MRSGKRDGGGADMSDANRYTELIAGAHFDKPKYQQFIYADRTAERSKKTFGGFL